jgi:carboxylesterase type B
LRRRDQPRVYCDPSIFQFATTVNGRAPKCGRAFLYSYEYEIDALSLDHVNHGFESNIIFGNNYAAPAFPNYMLTPADLVLHGTMAGYWSRFAATGEPGGKGELLWPPYGEQRAGKGARHDHMIFESEVRRGDDLREEACDFWDEFNLGTMLGAGPAYSR